MASQDFSVWSPTVLNYETCSSSGKNSLVSVAASNDDIIIRVVSLNCLAPSYVSEAGLPWLPKEHLTWKYREQSLFRMLSESECDIFCLQEFEPLECSWEKTFREKGYDSLVKIRPGRKDGCATFWKRSVFTLCKPIAFSLVDFNVLADMKNDFRYKRDNIALLVYLKLVNMDRTLIVANTHLHWNPNKSDVKLAQAIMLSQKIKEAASSLFSVNDIISQPATLLCGDLNSLPDSDVICFLQSGDVPINAFEGNDRRFICDRSLNKLCRWLRILGLDCVLESSEEEHERTKKQNFEPLFMRAQSEGRWLLSCSRRVIERANCPPSRFMDIKQLESSLVDMCRSLPVKLDPDLFLSRCVKCNSFVLEEKDWNLESIAHFDSIQPRGEKPKKKTGEFKEIPTDIPLFMCSNEECRQVYWFSARQNSSSVRSKEQAEHLYQQVISSQSQVLLEAPTSCENCDISVGSMYMRYKYMAQLHTKVMTSHSNQSKGAFRSVERGSYDTVDGKDMYEVFSSPYLEQCYVDDGDRNRLVSTVRNNFDGLIDHILYSTSSFNCVRRLILPSVNQVLSCCEETSGNLPSQEWGSDHLPIACDLVLNSI